VPPVAAGLAPIVVLLPEQIETSVPACAYSAGLFLPIVKFPKVLWLLSVCIEPDDVLPLVVAVVTAFHWLEPASYRATLSVLVV